MNYDDYLDGEEWPSESRTMANSTGKVETKWVGDMAPQYACSALGVLVRWARDSMVGHMEAAREEDRVRSSRLGQVLAAKALHMDDFTITEYVQSHGGLPTPEVPIAGEREVARTLAIAMLQTTTPMTPEEVGRLAVHMVHALTDAGFVVAQRD